MLTSTEMCEHAGCSYRMLDHWVRMGVLRPVRVDQGTGTGSRRRFSRRQLPIVRLLTDLAALGATHAVMREVVREVEIIPLDAWRGIAYVHEDGSVSLSQGAHRCWAVDLGRCAAAMPIEERQLVLA